MNKTITLEIIKVKPGDTLPTCEVLAWGFLDSQPATLTGILSEYQGVIWCENQPYEFEMSDVLRYSILPKLEEITG